MMKVVGICDNAAEYYAWQVGSADSSAEGCGECERAEHGGRASALSTAATVTAMRHGVGAGGGL